MCYKIILSYQSLISLCWTKVNWDKDRFDDICDQLKPFLSQTGFNPAKAAFVPVAALTGVNLASRDSADAKALNAWYTGPTLADLLGIFLQSL